jgi:hypothetical protein
MGFERRDCPTADLLFGSIDVRCEYLGECCGSSTKHIAALAKYIAPTGAVRKTVSRRSKASEFERNGLVLYIPYQSGKIELLHALPFMASNGG